MSKAEENRYSTFDLFRDKWALVTGGDIEHFNSCTVGWGSLGTLWTGAAGNGSMVTVYIHPDRYTCGFMRSGDTFTVGFFPEEYRKALSVMGRVSGRDTDKVKASGLTPLAAGGGVSYEEAELTIVCRKLYQGQFEKEGIDPSVRDYYINNPKAYPVDENGEWQPHWIFVGQVTDIIDKREEPYPGLF